jgi:hypothetical protein
MACTTCLASTVGGRCKNPLGIINASFGHKTNHAGKQVRHADKAVRPACFVLGLLQALEAGLLNKSSCLVPTLGATKFIIDIVIILATLCSAT